jgi:hypothetical protein
VAIGGNVTGSTIVFGDHNVVGSPITLHQEYIQQIYSEIDKRSDLDTIDKEDLKALVNEIKTEDEKGNRADETFIARRLRNIQRMAPDILDMALAIIVNPVAGFGLVAKKVAEKMQSEIAGRSA